jgi:predicted nucleotidyltransferase
MDRKTALIKARTFVKLAQKFVDCKRSYLFGSYAAGAQGDYSDLDVGIIVRRLEGDYLEVLTRLYRLRSKVDLRIEPHLIVEDADPLGFSEEIRRSGIRL